MHSKTTLDIQLREPVEADLPILYEHQRDPDASQMAAFPSRDWDAFMAHWRATSRDETSVQRIILASGRVAGTVRSWENDGLRLVGYVLGREHWGKGIATAALARFLDLVALRPLHALVVKHNVASIRVLEKNGFTLVREQTSHEHGMVIDDFLMRLASADGSAVLCDLADKTLREAENAI